MSLRDVEEITKSALLWLFEHKSKQIKTFIIERVVVLKENLQKNLCPKWNSSRKRALDVATKKLLGLTIDIIVVVLCE